MVFSPLCKNDEEEAAIRGFTDNQHASKKLRQQTTRVDMLAEKNFRNSLLEI